MKFRNATFALALAALPSALAAEPWEKVDELPGGIAVELDQDSVFEALDGARLVMRGTFRRLNGGWMMESNVAVDCGLETAKLRGIRLMDGDEAVSERSDPLTEFAPINPGSSEAIYYKALCGKDASTDAVLPDAVPEDAGADEPPVEGPEEEGLLPVEDASELPPPFEEEAGPEGERADAPPVEEPESSEFITIEQATSLLELTDSPSAPQAEGAGE